MPSLTEWRVPPANQPRAADYAFDLDKALSSVVGLHSIIPADAFSAETLGTERAGNGVVIDHGLVLTIGYLITEAEAVWLHRGDGSVVEGHDCSTKLHCNTDQAVTRGRRRSPAPSHGRPAPSGSRSWSRSASPCLDASHTRGPRTPSASGRA